jgi:hypothetical protein
MIDKSNDHLVRPFLEFVLIPFIAFSINSRVSLSVASSRIIA